MRQLKNLLLYVALSLAALIVLAPFLWMVATALKVPGTAEKLQFLPSQRSSLATVEPQQMVLQGLVEDLPSAQRLKLRLQNLYAQSRFPAAADVQHLIENFRNEPLNPDQLKILQQNFSHKLNLNTSDAEALIQFADLQPYEARALVAHRQNRELEGAHELSSLSLFTPERMQRIQTVFPNDPSILDRMDHSGYGSLLALSPEEVRLYQKALEQRHEPLKAPRDLLEIRLFDQQRAQRLSSRFFSNRLYTLANFKKVLFDFEPRAGFTIQRAFLNSLLVAVGTALLTVFLCTLAGYVFARKEFTGKKWLYAMFWASMLIPGMMFVVPQYAVVSLLGGVNSYWAMIVPHTANIFGLYLMRQTIEGIPISLFEAAALDGASEAQVLRIIVLPLSLPIMATLFLMTFLGQWSNFLWQLIVNTPDSMKATLPVTLALFRGQYATDWTILMAGASLMILPVLILFLFSQRFFIQGITQGAVKE